MSVRWLCYSKGVIWAAGSYKKLVDSYDVCYTLGMSSTFVSRKLRLCPTRVQRARLDKQFEACRLLYNHFLNLRKSMYLEIGSTPSYIDTCKILTDLKATEDFWWLKGVSSEAQQQCLRSLDKAYRRFFTKVSRFPRFKNKTSKSTFTCVQRVKISSDCVYMSKFREGIRLFNVCGFIGSYSSVTVTKTTTGKYYASVTKEQSTEYLPKTNSKVGVDTGIKTLAVLSNGDEYENVRALKTRLKKLKYEQRQMSKKKKGSASRNRQRIKLSRTYEKITNVRKDHLHKVSTEIVKNHDVIAVEDLNVKGMIENHCLAQALSDVSLGEFYRMLEYKSVWYGREYVKIDRFFPSSKTCSDCGWIKQDLTLKDREWTCNSCNVTHDRDLNAAKNILAQGLKILSVSGTDSDVKQKQVEASSIG